VRTVLKKTFYTQRIIGNLIIIIGTQSYLSSAWQNASSWQNATMCVSIYEAASLCTLFTDARYVLCLYPMSLSIKMKAFMRRDARGFFPRILIPILISIAASVIMKKIEMDANEPLAPNQKITIRALSAARNSIELE